MGPHIGLSAAFTQTRRPTYNIQHPRQQTPSASEQSFIQVSGEKVLIPKNTKMANGFRLSWPFRLREGVNDRTKERKLCHISQCNSLHRVCVCLSREARAQCEDLATQGRRSSHLMPKDKRHEHFLNQKGA